MKILMTTISLDPEQGGGCAGRTYYLARHLKRLGHECTVASIQDGAFAGRLAREGLGTHAFGFTRLRFAVPHIRLSKLASLVREADVVHILGYWNMLSVATAFLATRMGKPYVFSAAGEFVGLEPPVRFDKGLFHRLFGRRMVRQASSILAITALEKEQVIDRLGVPARFVDVIPNGVEPLEAEGEGTNVAPVDVSYILFMGRLTTVKGPDLLIEAFAKVAQDYPALSLVMSGPDAGMGSQLRAAVASQGLQNRVHFTGHLGEDARSAAYRGALFLVVPSRSEAMSLVALEAGMLGTPVLLTDRCGFDEVDAVGGGKVVATSVDGLAAGLRDMLSEPDALPLKGQRLQNYATRNFAWPTIATRMATVMYKAVSVADQVHTPRAPDPTSAPFTSPR